MAMPHLRRPNTTNKQLHNAKSKVMKITDVPVNRRLSKVTEYF